MDDKEMDQHDIFFEMNLNYNKLMDKYFLKKISLPIWDENDQQTQVALIGVRNKTLFKNHVELRFVPLKEFVVQEKNRNLESGVVFDQC